MRFVLLALTLGVLWVSAGPAAARDGCGYDHRGRLYCVDGRHPGDAYDGPRRGYRRYERDDVDWRRHFKHRCRRGEISIGGGSARVCIRIR